MATKLAVATLGELLSRRGDSRLVCVCGIVQRRRPANTTQANGPVAAQSGCKSGLIHPRAGRAADISSSQRFPEPDIISHKEHLQPMPPICVSMSDSTRNPQGQSVDAPGSRPNPWRRAAFRLAGLAVLLAILCLTLIHPAHAAPAFIQGGDEQGSDALAPDQAAPTETLQPAGEPAGQQVLVEYQVQSGDSLYDIAARNGIDVQTLISANNWGPMPPACRLARC